MTSTKKHFIVVLCVAVALMAVGTLVHVLVNTDFGNVKVDRVRYPDASGRMVSALIYIPKTATPDNPAPAVLTNHGGGNSLEAQGNYNVELARRGYVVVSWDASNSGSSEKSFDPTHGGEATYQFVQGLPFVQKDQLATSGHSMGGIYTFMIAQDHPDNVRIVIPVGMNPGMNDIDSPFTTNYACIIGSTDESALVRSNGDILNLAHNDLYHRFFKLAENEVLEVNKVYGDWEKGTAKVFYMPDSSHAASMINRNVIGLYLDVLGNVVHAPKPISSENQIWWVRELGNILQFAGLICFLFMLAVYLLRTHFFSSLKLAELKPVGFPRKSVPWFVSLAILVLLPPLLYIPFTTIAMRVKTPAFMSLDGTVNGIVIWSMLTGFALLLLFLVYHFCYGKKVGGNLSTYGLSTVSGASKIGAIYLGKACLYALCVVGGTFLVYLLMYAITKEDIHIWLATIRPITTIRFPMYPLYLLFQLPFFIGGSLAGRSISLNNGDRITGKGMRNSLLLSLLIGIAGLLVLFIVYWTTFKVSGKVLFGANRGYIYAVAIYSMLPAFIVGNLLNCYVTNKTNSVYAGVFAAMLWASWIMVGGNAIA